MATQQKRDRDKEQFCRDTFRAWRRSELSVLAYCAEHELTESLFYAWLRIIAERDQETAASVAAPPRNDLPMRVTIAALGREGPLAKISKGYFRFVCPNGLTAAGAGARAGLWRR